MTGSALAGSEEWIRHVLATHWGGTWGERALRPLTVAGTAPLTHTAGLWTVDGPEGEHVMKVQLNRDAVRAERFDTLKNRILTHCRLRGVPTLPVIPAVDGRPGVRHDGLACELSPRSAGSAVTAGSEEHAAAIVRAGLDLREALDAVPPGVAEELATVRLPTLVEEERWPAALDDAETRLLPKAEGGAGHWHRAAATALRQLAAAAPLLRRTSSSVTGPEAARGRAVVHGDLHLQHFLLAPRGPARVEAVLDFDNLHVNDRLLDLAWLADTAVCASGEEDPAGARAAIGHFLAEARGRGLLAPGEKERLMPLLMAHSLPVVVDIAKDILERGIFSPQWLEYFALLSPGRRLAVHRLLVAAPDF
ncbi:phosphotransferase [Streptomyces sp. NPDC005931]|uniref:phosphotransferase n=1 Tax=Streptomyces sp. NPDC005931 TaxID=3364737 RepID=UPI00369EA085